MSESQLNLPPFQAPSEHWFARLRATPLREALRGQLSGALDERRMIAAAQLPAPLDALVHDVVRRARLWPTERRDVAQELIAHFQDGLESGAAPEPLRARFGDPAQVAQLIRRAKLRNRSWAWQVWRRSCQAAGAMGLAAIVFYGILAVRYSLARPTIARNYVRELNDAQQAIPCDSRAWPIYREALLQMQPPPPDAWWWLSESAGKTPTAAEWEVLAAYVRDNAAALPILHRAATNPRLGYVWGDPANADLFVQRNMQDEAPSDDRPVMALLLPHVQLLREAAGLLAAAAALARHEGDASACRANLTAQLALAEQLRDEHGPVVEGLVSLAVYSLALNSLGETAAERPDLLSTEDWIDLAHRTASYAGGGSFRLDTTLDRQMFADILQRCFTDDGHGDGRLTADGLDLLMRCASSQFTTGPGLEWPATLAGPGISFWMASRKELADMAEALFNQMESSTQGPLWTWKPNPGEDTLRRLAGNPLDKARYAPVLLFLPAFDGLALATEMSCQRRDAVLTAIALEIYRREHGDWPQELADLTPRFLPQTPRDRCTGDPLCYRIRDGQPLLYARGADLRDDGGQLPADSNVRPDLDMSLIRHHRTPPASGYDWVLWPPSAARRATEEPAVAPPSE